jgi:hypothetical protein
MPPRAKQQDGPEPEQASDAPLTCGIVMPISAIDDCSEQHWSDVFEILQSAIESAGFKPNLVSNADEAGIIQKRIIQNLYENPIVVCDVSAKNPNVMFELGLRLAFDRPTIIVKDDKTSYSFDTAPIEHLEYPRDLRYANIVDFKEELARKIELTYKKAAEDPDYTTFLKNFGTFTVAKLDTKEVSKEEFILDELRTLRELIISQSTATRSVSVTARMAPKKAVLCLRETTRAAADELAKALITKYNMTPQIGQPNPSHIHLMFPAHDLSAEKKQEIVNFAATYISTARWLGTGGTPHLLPNTSTAKVRE